MSGADVAEDSRRGALKPLLDKPFLVDDAETEVFRVFDSSGLSLLWESRPLVSFVTRGTLRISCSRAGSYFRLSQRKQVFRTLYLPKMDGACLGGCKRLPPHASRERSHELFQSVLIFSMKNSKSGHGHYEMGCVQCRNNVSIQNPFGPNFKDRVREAIGAILPFLGDSFEATITGKQL